MNHEPTMHRPFEKFSRAVHALATSSGSIQQRLADAGYHFLAQFIEEDLPEDMREEYAELQQELTKIPDINVGSIVATALSLNEEDAKMYASRMVTMNEEIHRRWGYRQGLQESSKK
jgi:hypothetical protein